MAHRSLNPFRTRGVACLVAASAAILLAGCQSGLASTAVGPSRSALLKAEASGKIPGVRIVPITNAVASTAQGSSAPNGSFADAFGDAAPVGTIVGVGDVLEVTIWEAPPALLFGGAPVSTRIDTEIATSRPGTLPDLLVGPSGTITVPFAGQVPAAGRSLRQIEQTIVSRLYRKANSPQAIARVVRNATANVSVVGDVNTAGRVPLTPRGERLLDVVAQAGGTKQPVDRMTLQLSRAGRTVTMAMQDVVRDARHNVVLQRDDIITALYQPYSFTVLGAAGKNEEVRFEGVGLTLSQALGRIGGLQDQRADPRGVFLFRWEPGIAGQPVPVAAGAAVAAPGVPVIYQADLKNAETFFAAQNFQMRDGDVIFISNSPAVDLQRFVNLVASTVLPAVTLRNSVITP
jgi:polysaccharide biosynthesis/export protein